MLMPSIFGENLLDDFFTDPFKEFRRIQPSGRELMKTDIKEKKDSYELVIGLPGVNKEDIQAELKEGYLTVTATTSKENDEKDGDTYIRRERYYGSASRSFYVGEEVEQEDIKAKYENGVLHLEVPKKEPKKPEVEQKKYIAIEG